MNNVMYDTINISKHMIKHIRTSLTRYMVQIKGDIVKWKLKKLY